MSRINTKKEFIERWRQGDFGNRLQVWDTWEQYVESGFKGLIGLRYRVPAGRKTPIHITMIEAVNIIHREFGGDYKQFYYCESSPDSHLLMQGEYVYGTGEHGSFVNRHLTYSHSQKPMKPALAEQTLHAEGLQADMLIRRYFNANSYDDFKILQDTYPNSVIEFSCYDCCVGNIPGRNVIIWEVRNF